MRRVTEDRSFVRGHGMYGSEYRSHNRGFWHGQPPPNQFQGPPPQPPVRRPNIFFEAGRLATEYLVSNGVLPRNVLFGKWQNGSVKDYNNEEFHGGSRLQEGDGLYFPSDGRTSALSRLGDPISDLVTGKKRTADEFIPDSRKHMRRKRRMGWSFKNYESGKISETVLEKRRVSPESDAGNISSSNDGLKTSSSSLSMEKGTTSELKEQSVNDDEPLQPSVTPVASAKEEKDFNLLSLCKFAKVPTKARSLLTVKASKFWKSSVSNEDKSCNVESHVESIIVPIALTRSESLDSECLKEPTVAVAKTDNLITMDDDQGEQTECSHSLDRNLENQNDNPLESANCSSSSTHLDKEEKRDGEHVNSWNGTPTISHDNLESVDAPLFPKDSLGSCISYAEESQLFPASFRTCDLNLIENSETNDGFDANPLLIFQPPSAANIAPSPMDIDLCVSSNCNISEKYNRRTAEGKMVEVIDLEHDSVEEHKAFDHSDIKAADAVFTGLEDFPSHSKSTNVISANHDGFGLIISELLRTDITSSSSAPQSISLDNEMALHNGEGILDDDSIYMSLGEIPISFSPVWGQPTQDFGKPF